MSIKSSTISWFIYIAWKSSIAIDCAVLSVDIVLLCMTCASFFFMKNSMHKWLLEYSSYTNTEIYIQVMGDRLQYALGLPFSSTSLSVSWPWAVSAWTVSVWHRRSCFPRFWSRSCASFLVFGTMPLSTRRSTSTSGSTHSDLQKLSIWRTSTY